MFLQRTDDIKTIEIKFPLPYKTRQYIIPKNPIFLPPYFSYKITKENL